MTKLNQIIAVEKGVKTHAATKLAEVYHAAQKPNLFSGITRVYRPKDDEGDKLPPESTAVQTTVRELLESLREPLARMLDVAMIKDETNTRARADVIVNGRVVLADVPAVYLLFLEKQLGDLATFIAKLPRLDPAERWTWDDNVMAYVSEPVETFRSKKVPRNHVLAEATDRHPAQVQVWQEDVVVGYWKTVKQSGALPGAAVEAMLARVRELQLATKQAREQANTVEVIERPAGAQILEYVLS